MLHFQAVRKHFFPVVAIVAFLIVCYTAFRSQAIAASISCPNFTRPLLFGINPGGNVSNMYKAIYEAGGTATKLTLNWDISERSRGAYNFAQLDADIAEAEKYGLAVTILVVGTPDWAKEGSLPAHQALPRREFEQDYTRFLQTAARRYPQVTRYEYWNEQNGCGSSTGFCGNSDDSVRDYAYWLDITYKALKSVSQSIIVSVGGLDRLDEPFVERLHSSPGGRSYDVFSIHPYNWHGAIDLDSVKRLHQLAQKPIWITEYGWNVIPGADTSISEAQGAEFLSQSIERLASPEFSFVPLAFFHTMGDFSSNPAMGLIDSTGRKRPWHDVFRTASISRCPQPTPTPVPTPVPTPSPTPVPRLLGDFNRDNKVDIFDVSIAAGVYDTENCFYNQVGDCKIDLFDFNTIVENFDKTI
ncbi:MAG: glycosyl hydrolase [bacterium]|nr:glycosyl hydrolase [bacterium]